MMNTMDPIPALGITFVPSLPPERLRGVATAAEQSGLDELWVWEDCFKQSGVATATAALACTERLTVGIGLLPVPLRNVAVCAMEIATLERMFPGRLIAGIGHGVQSWMGQVGARPESPMTLLREYTTALRALLGGERIDVDGRYVHLEGVALDWPPSVPPPLMLGGAGPKSLVLSGELGDGSLLSSAMTVDEMRDACALIRSTAGDAHQVACPVLAATGPQARQRLDQELPTWGKPSGSPVGITGDAEEFAESIRRIAGLGITSIAIQPCEDEPDLEGLVHFLGTEVRPLLHRS